MQLDYDLNDNRTVVKSSMRMLARTGDPSAGQRVITDLAGQGTHVRRQLIVGGEALGEFGVGPNEAQPLDPDRQPQFEPRADFSFGYQPISGNYPGAAPGAYTVRQGDSLKSIARSAYGDSRLWYRIAEANGLGGDDDLRVGQTLTIPAGVGTVHNDEDTFEPYDPGADLAQPERALRPPRVLGNGTTARAPARDPSDRRSSPAP